MLKLRADFSIKLNSVYSIFVTFPYNQYYVDLMKNMKNRSFDNVTKVWEIGWDCYSQLIGTLNAYGIPYNGNEFMESVEELKYQIELREKKYKKDSNIDSSILDKVEFKTPPFSYQKEGIAYMLEHDKCLIADEQGLGKTYQTLNTAVLKKGGKHCLIIAGYDTLQFNWVAEVEKHTNEKAYVLGQRTKRNGRVYLGTLKDRLDDINNLDKIEEFFIVTAPTTIRQCVKKEYLKKNGKKGFNKIYTNAQLLEAWCQKGEIGRIIYDEFQTCLHGKDQLFVNNHIISMEKLYEVFQKTNKTLYINSYNETTGIVEPKPIKHMTKSINKVEFIKLNIEVRGKFIELKLTPNHLVYTKNRGYIKAEYLTPEDELLIDEQYYNSDSINKFKQGICPICGNTFITSDTNKIFCSTNCSALYRNQTYGNGMQGKFLCEESINKMKQTKANNIIAKEQLINRMKNNNPIHQIDVVKKIRRKKELKGILHKFCGTRGGNGHISIGEQQVYEYLISLGFIYNKGIGTKELKHAHPEINWANVYKPDFYLQSKKIAIEIDGKQHKNKKGILLDEKKEQALKFYNINTYRFTNEYVLNNFEEFKEKVIEICSLVK